MRLAHPEVAQDNRMMVTSVFLHCLILGAAILAPKPEIDIKVIQPAFQVQLIELATGKTNPPPAPIPPVKVKETKPTPTKSKTSPTLKKPSPRLKKNVKPIQKDAPKPVARKKTKSTRKKPVAVASTKKRAVIKPEKARSPAKAPNKTRSPVSTPIKTQVKPLDIANLKPLPVSKMVNSEAPKKIFKELEQVAALPPKTTQKVKPKPIDTFLEEQVRELEAMKASKPLAVTKKSQETAPEIAALPKPTATTPTKTLKKFEELMTAKAGANAPRSKPTGRSKDLFKELDSISALGSAKPIPNPSLAMPTIKMPSIKQGGSKEIEQLKEQLASLDTSGIKVEVEAGQPSKKSKASGYRSQIHSLTAPDPTKNYVVATVERPTFPSNNKSSVNSNNEGKPGANLLALYVGLIERTVMKNWKNPIGSGNGKLHAAFRIYSGGTIDPPSLVQSSGNPALDSLALRAIKLSEPFPPFPKELKESNLHIRIHFSYVPQQ